MRFVCSPASTEEITLLLVGCVAWVYLVFPKIQLSDMLLSAVGLDWPLEAKTMYRNCFVAAVIDQLSSSKLDEPGPYLILYIYICIFVFVYVLLLRLNVFRFAKAGLT